MPFIGNRLDRCPWLAASWIEKPRFGMRGLRAIQSKCVYPPRLETRTKESILYASVRVEKPERIEKSRISC